jgi:glutathione S-transferase
MIVYGSSLSPFVRKVLAFAEEKGIEVESRPGGGPNADEGFREASPFGKIPALRDGEYTLADSSAIIHYLEAMKPDPQLIPTDARARGRTIWFDEFADTILAAACTRMFFNRIVAPRFMGREGDLDAADTAEREELPKSLDYLERVIPSSLHLVEDRLTLADIAVATCFANFRHMGTPIDAGRYPRVTAFAEAMLKRPSFANQLEQESRVLAA